MSAIEAASRRGIGGVIVFASGFAEVDEQGAHEQRAIAEFALRHDIALAGPNCLGLINFAEGVPLTFGDASPNRRSTPRGVSILAQSGAMTLALTYAAMAQDITVNYAISTGNEAVLGVEDYLGVILEEQETRVIALLVEQIRQPELFLSLARLARQRSIVLCVLHLGRGERARAASITHTGALAQDQAVLRAILEREGVLFIDSLDELIDTVDVLTKCSLPLSRGVGLLTDSGAMKTFALDVGDSLGLSLPELSEGTRALLSKELPVFAVAENPVDITAMGLNDPSLYARATSVLLDDVALGSVVLCVMPGSPVQGTEQIEALLPTLIAARKPVIYTILGGESPIPSANRERIADAGIPLFRSPDRALRALRNVTQLSLTKGVASQNPSSKTFAPLRVPSGQSLNEREAKELLAGVGVQVPVGQLATSEEEVFAAAAAVGFPLVLKVSSSEILHKSDVGGVAFVGRKEDLLSEYRQLLARLSQTVGKVAYEGVLVEKAAVDGTEMIVGAH
ncbi:MAG: acetate--CoA ligase family protein, partial [Acidimicrobiales bacterium]